LTFGSTVRAIAMRLPAEGTRGALVGVGAAVKIDKVDVVVVGAGMGGMCAAARLAAAGLSTVVVEKSPYLGGRCSHRERDGCRVTTGAIMIPMGEGSAIRGAFDAVGAHMDMVETTGAMRYRLSHGDYDLPAGGGGLYGMLEFALRGNEKAARQLFQHFRDALFGSLPADDLTFETWLAQRTSDADVKGLFHGFCAALMGTNPHEIPAGEFFRFLKCSSRGSRFGLAANGNGALMESLAAAICNHGGFLRCSTRCQRIEVGEGRATAVVVRSAGGVEERITADFVISNLGPDRTVELAGGAINFDQDYLLRLRTNACEAPIIHFSFLTDEPLIDGFTGCLVFGNTRNLIYLEIPSLISPVLAPSGTYLHTAYGAPTDSAGGDLDLEADNALRELEENFPGAMANARFLVRAKHRGQAPGMHRWPGHMMPVETPILNLFNVGDGCTPAGTIGTEGAAASARAAVESILSQP
jgi:phytoene dehydrogenase-like protein